MANGQRTANEVAQLETEVEILRNENEQLHRQLAIVSADRSRLQIENAMLAGQSRDNLVKATTMETIIRQVAAGMVESLNVMTRERAVERAMKQRGQEQVTEEQAPDERRSLQRDEDDQDQTAPRPRNEMGPSKLPTSPPVIDTTLASRDPRLPMGPFVAEADRQELSALAGLIGNGTRRV
jgi:hypothetical protein